MSFPSSFGAQVAAIMDAMAKAAVAEITKLVEDGSLVLRLEIRRRDSEIQELRSSLKLIEAQVRKAQEAATTRATEDKQDQTTAEVQVPKENRKACQEMSVVYLEPKAADFPHESQNGTEESQTIRPVVKHMPEDEPANTDAANNTARAAGVCFKAVQGDSVWAASNMFEKSSVAIQQHMQVFPSHTAQYSAHRNTESSHNSLPSAGGETANVPVKVELVEIRPVCMGGTTSNSVQGEEFRHISPPAVSQGDCLQAALQHIRPSLALPHTEKSTATVSGLNTQVLNQSGNSFKAKRVLNMWRTNQKVFICSVCNKSFSCLSQLERHKATHQPSKPFRCLECGKCFTQKTRLRTHQSVHTGERPYSCKICGKMFSRQDNCLRHERFHSGLRPYSCRQCGKSFAALGNLKIHQQIHLQGR